MLLNSLRNWVKGSDAGGVREIAPRKRRATCDFASWAVTGSNRRPLRCKGE